MSDRGFQRGWKLRIQTGFVLVVLCCSPVTPHGQPQLNGTQLRPTYRRQLSASSHILGTLIGEHFLADNVAAVRERVAAMPGEDRFDYLRDCVLPANLHSTIRMNGEFTQTEPAPVAVSRMLNDDTHGGELVSPVFDLLDVTMELGKLEEFWQRIIKMSNSNDTQQRERSALLLLVNLEFGDEAAISKAAGGLRALVLSATPTGMADMWPETLVVYRGMYRPKQNLSIVELLNTLYSQRTKRSLPKGSSQWHAHISALMLRHRYAEERRAAMPGESPNAFDSWISVGRTLAWTRGRGAPHANWTRNGHVVRHRSSHDNDLLFYQSPMRGRFRKRRTDYRTALEQHEWNVL